MKTITVGQLRQNPTDMLDGVLAGETYQITRHARAIARIVPVPREALPVSPRKRQTGSRLGALVRHELRSADNIDVLLGEDRDR